MTKYSSRAVRCLRDRGKFVIARKNPVVGAFFESPGEAKERVYFPRVWIRCFGLFTDPLQRLACDATSTHPSTPRSDMGIPVISAADYALLYTHPRGWPPVTLPRIGVSPNSLLYSPPTPSLAFLPRSSPAFGNSGEGGFWRSHSPPGSLVSWVFTPTDCGILTHLWFSLAINRSLGGSFRTVSVHS
ncbi:hypothetical protein BHM03_00012438 [Ensete ventricosum]|nr:hypothetical protein BHM03_00012438 [Ensete ventricosum]